MNTLLTPTPTKKEEMPVIANSPKHGRGFCSGLDIAVAAPQPTSQVWSVIPYVRKLFQLPWLV